eukprot:scaffold22126_cov70-Phaeocystis_antarctica.AAC.3
MRKPAAQSRSMISMPTRTSVRGPSSLTATCCRNVCPRTRSSAVTTGTVTVAPGTTPRSVTHRSAWEGLREDAAAATFGVEAVAARKRRVDHGWYAYGVRTVLGAPGQAALRLWYKQHAGGQYAVARTYSMEAPGRVKQRRDHNTPACAPARRPAVRQRARVRVRVSRHRAPARRPAVRQRSRRRSLQAARSAEATPGPQLSLAVLTPLGKLRRCLACGLAAPPLRPGLCAQSSRRAR